MIIGKLLKIFAAGLIAFSALFIASSCGGEIENELGVQLAAPTNLRVEDEYVVWDEVDGADGYHVEINNAVYLTETNKLDILEITTEMYEYEISVKAIGDGKSLYDSYFSEVYCYNLETDPNEVFSFERVYNNGVSEYKLSVSDNEKMKGKIVIPEYGPDEKSPVTEISGFQNCADITAVIMGDSVKKMGKRCFARCVNLSRLILSDNIEEIPAYCFDGCENLKTFYLPKELIKINNRAFSNCSSIEYLYIGENLEEINLGVGNETFLNCKNLKKVTVASGNENFSSEGNCIVRLSDKELILGFNDTKIPPYAASIGEGAFAKCEGLTEIVIPGNVKTVKSRAFYGCVNLSKVVFEEGVESLYQGRTVWGDLIFAGCTNLSEIYIPSTVKKISPDLLLCSNKIKTVSVDENNENYSTDGNFILSKDKKVLVCGRHGDFTLPDGVIEIGPLAFCEAIIRQFDLPETVEKIDDKAFMSCKFVNKNIVIPENISYIGKNAFSGCLFNGITISSGATKIDDEAFLNGDWRSSVVLTSTENLGKNVFKNDLIYLENDDFKHDKDDEIDWAENCIISYMCGFGYDEGFPYLQSVYFHSEKNDEVDYIQYYNTCTLVVLPFPVPCRDGYTFAGWTTVEGGENAEYGKPYINAKTNQLNFIIDSQIPEGTRLYVVWVKND